MNGEHFNGLSPEAAELIALLIEECAEVQQACTKILRQGMTSEHPVSGDVNIDTLHREIGDVFAAVELLAKGYYVSMPELQARKRDKLLRVGRYLHHARVPDSAPAE